MFPYKTVLKQIRCDLKMTEQIFPTAHFWYVIGIFKGKQLFGW